MIPCIHKFWEITPGSIKTTHHSQYGDAYMECVMRCQKCHMSATATRVEYSNESSVDITQ